MNCIEELFERLAEDNMEPPPAPESLDDAIGFISYVGRRIAMSLDEFSDIGLAWQEDKASNQEFGEAINSFQRSCSTLATLIAAVLYQYQKSQEEETRH